MCGGVGGCGGGPNVAQTAATPGQVGTLQGQLTDGLQQLQQLGVNVNGGGATSFAAAEAKATVLPLPQVLDGPGVLAHLGQISNLRAQRFQELQAGLQADAQRTGAMNPVDQQKLALEQQVNSQLGAIVQKLTPLAGTIDQNEAASLIRLVQNANQTGSFDAAQLQRVMINIEGTARNLPASYLASANRATDVLAGMGEQLRQMSNAASATIQRTGAPDPAQLQQVQQYSQLAVQFGEAVKRNFDLATVNPSAAQARLDSALQSNDPAQIIQQLG